MNRFQFTKADRLLKRSEFFRLSAAGERIDHRFFTAVFSPNVCDRTRLGITVSKKVGGAVVRNRIKRLCREFFRLNRHTVTGEWDINIIAKKEAAALTSQEAFLSLQHIFKKLSRMIDNQNRVFKPY